LGADKLAWCLRTVYKQRGLAEGQREKKKTNRGGGHNLKPKKKRRAAKGKVGH